MLFPSPYGERVKESGCVKSFDGLTFQVSIPLRGKGKGKEPLLKKGARGHICTFPSPYGERVKERRATYLQSILYRLQFPSPYGERVKERFFFYIIKKISHKVSIPLRGKGKGKKLQSFLLIYFSYSSFHPLTGKG